MKKGIDLLYWSLPILFAIVWFFLTLVFTPIYESYFRDTRELGLSPRVGIIMLSPFLLFIAVTLLYTLLYIERKLIYNWNVIIGINAFLIIAALMDVIGGLTQSISDTSETAGWGCYHALEVCLKYIPFILISFYTLSCIKKRDSHGEKKDIHYVLFYLLPLLFVCYSAILGYVFAKAIECAHITIGDVPISTVSSIGMGTVLIMPICTLILTIYEKVGKNKWLTVVVTITSIIVMTAYWCYMHRNMLAENAPLGMAIVCFMVLPWTLASHFISRKFVVLQHSRKASLDAEELSS